MKTLFVVVCIAASVGVTLAGQSQSPSADGNTIIAKTYTPPRTPDGQPDLQGVWWRNSATPFERPKVLEGREFLTDDEVAELKKRAERIFSYEKGNSDFAAGDSVFLAAWENVQQYKNPRANGGTLYMAEKEFDTRTSLVVDPLDGRIPPLTPEAQQHRSSALAATQRLPDSAEDLSDSMRCISYGVPKLAGRYADPDYSYHQIVQTPEHVVLMFENIHDARIIPLDGRPHLPESIRQWNGDSRGHWEGNTLVIDTTNFSSKSKLTGPFSAPTNFMESLANLHLTERFTRIAPEEIRYEVTLNDPSTWTKPWTVMIRLRQTQERMYEFACHEGNHSMVGILAGARAQEKAATEVAKKGSR